LKNLTRFPLHKQLHNNIGLLYKQTYEYELALKHLNKALDIDPYFLDANLNLGLFHSELKDFQLAEKYLKQALTIDPNNSRARELLGKLNLN
jgi:tetratricopeptide (TPR) repeat protein